MDQAAFARRVGVNRTTVVSWESDGSRPWPRYLDRLARVTGKPVSWFLDGIPDEDL